jgi:hypothetical protein
MLDGLSGFCAFTSDRATVNAGAEENQPSAVSALNVVSRQAAGYSIFSYVADVTPVQCPSALYRM